MLLLTSSKCPNHHYITFYPVYKRRQLAVRFLPTRFHLTTIMTKENVDLKDLSLDEHYEMIDGPFILL